MRYPVVFVAVVLVLIPLRAWAGDVQGALAYVPSDSIAVVGADVDKVRSSPLYASTFETFLKESGAKKKVAELAARTGLDVRRHIHAVVAAFPPTFPQDDDEFVIIAEAKVNEARLVAFAKKEGAEIQRRDSPLGPYYALDGGDGALAFRGKFVILGGQKTFQKALRAARGQSAKTHGKLAPRLGLVSQHDVFGVADLPPKVRQEARGVLPGGGEVRAVSATIDVQKGVQVHAKATTDSAKTASQIAAMVQAFLDESGKDPELKKQGLDGYLSLLSVQAAGADLEASLVLTNTQLQRLIGMLKNM
ncbi:MAG: hypothetical protein JRI23_08360 [Deltaproteobacteria bacterium]|jgi:hypothetical protein|nr:hypothetical protein [Deltaproteobacteria bacterium]MBW2531626.1 hypothetical protein [Deltaproteobacteria bacterium]